MQPEYQQQHQRQLLINFTPIRQGPPLSDLQGLSLCSPYFVLTVTMPINIQRRSWPGGPGVRTPPELPSGVRAKCKNPVRIFFLGGRG